MWDEVRAKRLGEVLRALRTERDLSQESLAYQSGITKNQLQLLESGRASGKKDEARPSNPQMATLTGLSMTLGVSLAELMRQAEL